ncbi:hypothetical protein Syun_002764 [Stephania yunnanensis]|uniref:Manganese-transporting ATPase PDR2 n=1 Tax=Stephania yunnanensis TaxID=152371 RepID=A0AAP0LKA4_9MAGN
MSRYHVDGKVVQGVDLLKKRHWPWRLDVWPFAILYTIWILTVVPSVDFSDALVVLAGLLAFHVLALLFTAWSVDFRCFVQFSKVRDIQNADACKITPAKFSGAKEIVELCCRQPLTESSSTVLDIDEVFFDFRKQRFIFSKEKDTFCKLPYPTKETFANYLKSTGHGTEAKLVIATDKWGRNIFEYPQPTFRKLMKEHCMEPFLSFKYIIVFCVGLWCLDEYWYYSLFTLFMLFLFESTMAKSRLKTLTELRRVRVDGQTLMVHRSGKWVQLSGTALLPGDVVSIGRSSGQNGEDKSVPADMLILAGSAIVNEAILTGESTPQWKVSISGRAADEKLSAKRDKSHILFGGTKILQHTPDKSFPLRTPNGGCLAVVLRTGFETSQGKLMRTILFSTERVTANSWESGLFILFLVIFAVIAAGYVLKKGLEDPTRSRYKLFLSCSLIITSVIPPELPMELSIAVNTSLIALARRGIFCTEPFRIPFAGKVDICCFDKTGTLTSDDMEFRGVVGLSESTDLESDMSRVPVRTAEVLASCHALVYVDNRLVGDPLEKAAIKGIDWNYTSDEKAVPRRFMLKLNELKSHIKEWNHLEFGRVEIRRNELENLIGELDFLEGSSGWSHDLDIKRREAKVEWGEISIREEKIACQKAKLKWLKEGDNGVVRIDDGLIEEEIIRFFTNLYTSRGERRIGVEDIQWTPISEAQNIHLERPFSKEELESALMDCGGSKALGPDGFTLQFFIENWDLFREDLMVVMVDFYHKGIMNAIVNETYICLIPKKENSYKVSDFRPISLVSSLYKIIAKVLAKRLRNVLQFTFSESKLAFVQGRQILDAVFVANEMVEDYRRRNKKRVIDREMAKGNLKGFVVGKDEVHVSHLQFADDTLFLIDGDIRFIDVLVEILNEFCDISGLRIDIGLLLGGDPNTIEFWAPVVGRIARRLASWRKSFLSKGGDGSSVRFWEDKWLACQVWNRWELFSGGGVSTSRSLEGVVRLIQLIGFGNLQGYWRQDGFHQVNSTKDTLSQIGFTIGNGLSSRGGGCAVQIIQRHHFASHLKRMAVVVRIEEEFFAFVKGAPEVIRDRLVDLPSSFVDAYKKYTRQGSRVLALAYKSLPEMTVSQARSLDRDSVESDLTFAGFAVFNCPIRADSASVLSELKGSSHDLAMITGDQALTACYVASQVHIISKPALILCPARSGGGLEWISPDESETFQYRVEEVETLSDTHDLCIGGDCFEMLQQTSAVLQVIPYAKVFARVAPEQKELIMTTLKTVGRMTLMCGDGTNDVGALKQANVGVALLNAVPPSQTGESSSQTSRSDSKPSKSKKSKPGAEASTSDGHGRLRTPAQNDSASSSGNNRQMTPAERQRQKLKQLMDEMNEEGDGRSAPVVQLGDASMASPFTAKHASVAPTTDIIRQGRSTLVTTLQMFKILGLNCLATAYVLSVMYLDGVKLGDVQATISGIFTAAFFLFISHARPLPTLSAERPHPNIFCAYVLLSLLGQFAIHLIFLISSVNEAGKHMPEECIEPDSEFHPNLVNTVSYMVNMMIQVATFAVNYMGHPFNQSIPENKPLLFALVGAVGFFTVITSDLFRDLNNWLKLVPLPEGMREKLLFGAFLMFISCYAWERLLRWIFPGRKPEWKRRLRQATATQNKKNV